MSAYFRVGEKTNFRHRSSIKIFPFVRRFNIFLELPPQTPYPHIRCIPCLGQPKDSRISRHCFFSLVFMSPIGAS